MNCVIFFPKKNLGYHGEAVWRPCHVQFLIFSMAYSMNHNVHADKVQNVV